MDFSNAYWQRFGAIDGKWPCRPSRQVLREAERQLWLALQTRLDPLRYVVLAASPLSGLIGYRNGSRAIDRHLRQTVVSVAVLTREMQLLIAVLDTATNVDLRRELSQLNVPFCLLQPTSIAHQADTIEAKLAYLQPLSAGEHGRWKQRLLARHARDAMLTIWGPERALVSSAGDKRFTSALATIGPEIMQADWMLLEEVALQRIIELDRGKEWLIRRYLLESSVDALIISASPHPVPLLAIEYDGEPHDTPAQRLKDGRKNLLFADAGIPFIRVSHANVRLKRWDRASSDERAAMSRYLDPLKLLMRVVAGRRLAMLRNVDEYLMLRGALAKLRNTTAAELYGDSYDSLTQQQQAEVDWTADEIIERRADVDERLGFIAALCNDPNKVEPIQARLARAGVDPQLVSRVIVEEPSSANTCWSARAVVTTAPESAYEVHAPALYVTIPGVEAAVVESDVRSYFYDVLVEEVAQMLAV